jgi:hypothetical protein
LGNAHGEEVSKGGLSARNLHRWVAGPTYELSFQRIVDSESIARNRARTQEEIQIATLDIPVRQFISGLAISGDFRLNGKRSLVRVILIDNQSKEHLVYEAFPLITPGSMPDGGKFHISDACQESCVVDDLLPASLRIELVSASISLTTIDFISSGLQKRSPAEVVSKREKIRSAQAREIIDRLNMQLMIAGLKWVADATPISKLRYAEKKKLFGYRGVPNLQGFEYYRGGVFEFPARVGEASLVSSAPTSSFVPSFDWRARHGANNSNSPYYDGDPTGSGWITSVKMQLCADCWAHAANGAVEAG